MKGCHRPTNSILSDSDCGALSDNNYVCMYVCLRLLYIVHAYRNVHVYTLVSPLYVQVATLSCVSPLTIDKDSQKAVIERLEAWQSTGDDLVEHLMDHMTTV